MKKIIIYGVLALASFLPPQIIQAQAGMTYVSSLSQTSTGNVSVGSDSWLAQLFGTGNNPGGYMLDSIQLGMADASGSPSNFTVMLYTAFIGGATFPGSSLGTLDGSLSPTTAGIYTFTSASNLMLSPNKLYYIVLTAGTTVANGAYSWSESAYPPSINNWGGVGNGILQSANGISGSSWSPTPYLGIAQFAINAMPIPEPGVLSLISLGGLAFFWHRRKTKAV